MMRFLRKGFSEYIPKQKIRNFCIIAHIDHGKSTLADRFLELTNTIPKGSSEQFLDKLQVQRQRGITVQAQTVSMFYHHNNEKYLLNLVDTPGHIDFYYEVQRSMRGCQGAILLVDATQGIQAQTLANYQLAKREKLKIIPVLNKIDMACNEEQMENEVKNQLFQAQKQTSITKISAKTGLNVQKLLMRIIDEVPPPKVGDPNEKLKLFLINSWFLSGKNVVCLFYVMSGTLKKGTTIVSSHFGKPYQIFQSGILQPELVPTQTLTPGQIGYVLSNMKQVKEARIGDTFYKTKEKVEAEPGFQPSKPMMYAGVYPINPEDFPTLSKNLEKLVLTDPAVTFAHQSNATLGSGFRCGFLGMLHMDVFKQRLRDQYDIQAILTSPSVPYKCKLKSGKIIHIESALDAPSKGEAEYFEEPMVLATIVLPFQFVPQLKSLCQNKRGEEVSQVSVDNKKYILKYKLPLSQIIIDFVDSLKSITHGYGSFDYEPDGFKKSDVVKMTIYIMNDPVDALTFLIHEKRAFDFGKQICRKLKEIIPQQLFTINIQARVGTKAIAKEDIPYVKKHVTAKCYGGDYSRKKKLLDRYKEGKKKLKSIGKVEVPADTFIQIMKQ